MKRVALQWLRTMAANTVAQGKGRVQDMAVFVVYLGRTTSVLLS
jgi:hypothetical protein